MTKDPVYAAEVNVDLNEEFSVTLKGSQIQFMLDLLKRSTFVGHAAFLVVETIYALQRPILIKAHGAAPISGAENGQ